MTNPNNSNFKEIVRQIENNEILLPDFQRDFVWKDEDQQKKLIASVLSKMPIGSILLLHCDPNDYSAKVIGSARKTIDTKKLKTKGPVDFLIDGQQRITVLANVFSNTIHELTPNVNDLVAPKALKRRFFLRIPKWEEKKEDTEQDWFGVRNLVFPLDIPESDDPEFLTANILEYIHMEPFLKNDGQPFNPAVKLTTNLDNFCIQNDSNGYLIPLYLICSSKSKGPGPTRYTTIIETISNGIKGEIMNHYMSLDTDAKKKDFIQDICDGQAKDVFSDDADEQEGNFVSFLTDRQKNWHSDVMKYLESCVTSISLHTIRVNASQRARAIDIYENLNRGGVSLSTFDLIMARVAKVNKRKHENFHHRMKREMLDKKKSYPTDVLPPNVDSIIKKRIDDKKYNATKETKCYSESKNEFSPKYIDVFLDVLGMTCGNKDNDPEKVRLEYIKKNFILNLTPESIDKNCEAVIKAIDRAMFFLQTRCGIRNIQEVNYSLIIVLIAVVFLDGSNFEDVKVHNLLEAWYWSVLFSGEYDKDQNVTMIANLQNMLRTIKENKDPSWIKSIESYVLKMTNFSDKDLLLMDKVDQDRTPKGIIRSFVCQFILSRPYSDLFSDEKISVFCKDADDLEAHHIVPLGSAKKVGEVTSELRKNPNHICNSPLNFVYITKATNKAISDEPLDQYVKKITPKAKTALHLTSYSSFEDGDTIKKVKKILSDRYEALLGDLENRIDDLLQDWTDE